MVKYRNGRKQLIYNWLINLEIVKSERVVCMKKKYVYNGMLDHVILVGQKQENGLLFTK